MLITLYGNPLIVFADDQLNSADTAWILTSAGWCCSWHCLDWLYFTAAWYAPKMCFRWSWPAFITSLISLVWAAAGYSLAFDWRRRLAVRYRRCFPSVFVWDECWPAGGQFTGICICHVSHDLCYFCTAFDSGCIGGKSQIFPLLLFCALWELFVYVPICHWIWGMAGWQKKALWILPEELLFMVAPVLPPWSEPLL